MAEVLSSYAKQLDQEKMPAGKKKVLLAALDLFSNNGFHATTTANIAKKAGVSEGTIYKYFKSKDDLLSHLLTPLLIKIRDNFFVKLHDYSSLDELVSFIVKDRMKFINDNFDLVKLLIQEVLTGQNYLPYFKDAVFGKNGLLTSIKKIKSDFPEINQDLTLSEIIRIFVGPVFAYVLQKQLFTVKCDEQTELTLIKKQIIAGLTK